MTTLPKLNIKEGTINFWIKENQLNFTDSKTTPIFAVSPEGGSIFMVKDQDNKLKVFFVVLDKGRTDLEYDTASLSSDTKHMFSLTWNLNKKELNLYIDGVKVVQQEIK